jgi:hypothetical protein
MAVKDLLVFVVVVFADVNLDGAKFVLPGVFSPS